MLDGFEESDVLDEANDFYEPVGPDIILEKLDIAEIPDLFLRIQQGQDKERLPCLQKLCLLALRKNASIPHMIECGVLTLIADLMKDPLPEDLYVACTDLLSIINLRYSPVTEETTTNFLVEPFLTISEEADPELYMSFLPGFASILTSSHSHQLALLSTTFTDRLPSIISYLGTTSRVTGDYMSAAESSHDDIPDDTDGSAMSAATQTRLLITLLEGITSFLSTPASVPSTSTSAEQGLPGTTPSPSSSAFPFSTTQPSGSSSSSSSSSSANSPFSPIPSAGSPSNVVNSNEPQHITQAAIDNCTMRLFPLIPILPAFAASSKETIAENAGWILRFLKMKQRSMTMKKAWQSPADGDGSGGGNRNSSGSSAGDGEFNDNDDNDDDDDEDEFGSARERSRDAPKEAVPDVRAKPIQVKMTRDGMSAAEKLVPPVPPPPAPTILPALIVDQVKTNVFEFNLRRDLNFILSQKMNAVVDGSTVTLTTASNTTILLDAIIAEGCWHCAVQFEKTGKGKRAIGIVNANATVEGDYPLGADKDSLGYYGQTAPVRQNGQWVIGNEEWTEGDVVHVEVNMMNKVKTVHFWVNSQQQPIYFTHIPSNIRFAAMLTVPGSSIKVLSLKRLSAPSAKIVLWESAVEWIDI